MADPEPVPGPPPTADPGPSWVREADDGSATTIEENWLFRLRRERFRSRRTGRAHDYYVMHLADAVNVIALTPDDRLVLVRQFRAGSGLDSLEPPGGLLEPGEDPCEAGARELLEETGYAGAHAVFLGQAWSNPSIMTSKIAVVVVANALRVADPKPDAGEEVSVELVPARSVPWMIRTGRIDHALSVMALLLWINSRWPGPLANPLPPKPRLTIARIMTVIAVVGLVLAGLTRMRDPMIALIVALFVIGLAVTLTGRIVRSFKGYPWLKDRFSS